MPGILKTSAQNFLRSNSAPTQLSKNQASAASGVLTAALSQIDLSIKGVHFNESFRSGQPHNVTVKTYEIDREEVLFKKDIPPMRKLALLVMPQRGPLMKATGSVSMNSKKKRFDSDYDAKKFRNELACKTPATARKLGELRSELVSSITAPPKGSFLRQAKTYKVTKASIKNHSDLMEETRGDLGKVKAKARILFNNEKIVATKALLSSENDLSEEEVEKRAFIFAEHKVERTFVRKIVQLDGRISHLEEDIDLLKGKKGELKKNSIGLRAFGKMGLL